MSFPEVELVFIPTLNEAITYLRQTSNAYSSDVDLSVGLSQVANYLVKVVQLLEAVADAG